jgi:hypothetical protein
VSEQAQFDPKFNMTLFSAVIREIMIFRMNQMALVNTANHFWQAQQDAQLLRGELEAAYRSVLQKAQNQKKHGGNFPELWMFGYLAYQRITEDGLSLKAFLEMPKTRMAQQALALGEALKAKAAQDGDGVYQFEKKSREKE